MLLEALSFMTYAVFVANTSIKHLSVNQILLRHTLTPAMAHIPTFLSREWRMVLCLRNVSLGEIKALIVIDL